MAKMVFALRRLSLKGARQFLPLQFSSATVDARNMVNFIFSLLLCLWGWTAWACPPEALHLQSTMDGIPLGWSLEYLVDSAGQYDESTIAQAPPARWSCLKTPFRNFGHLHAPVWIRFVLVNGEDGTRTFYLENNYSLTDRITLVETDGSGMKLQTLGDTLPFAGREIRYRNPVFVLHVPTGAVTYYAKIDTSELVTLAFKLWDPASFNSMMNQESMLIGLLFGITVALLLYNLILLASTGLALLRPYCLYVLFFILTEFCLIGVSQIVIPDPDLSRWLSNSGFRLFLTLGIFAALAFLRLFLNLKKLRPGLDRITRFGMLALLLLAIYHLADGPDANILISGALSVCSVHFIVCSLVMVRDGYRPARILLVAWTLIITGSGVSGFADLGMIDGDMGRILLWHFGAGCLEMILLSLAIGDGWRMERQRRRQEAARAEAIRVTLQARQDHAFGQLKKLVYPHQLESIMEGQQLEQTMPVGKAQAAVIAFDIVASSQVAHDTIQDFLRKLFAACHASMMKNYQPQAMEANAYRIKETGDGFLCSIGYPFRSAGGKPVADVAVSLAQEFVQIFHHTLRDFPALAHLTCCCGVALDRVESFFPQQGVQVYDLYGRAIVLATRYEALRKETKIFAPQFSYIILQERVHQNLSEPYRSQFERLSLASLGIRVRDDAEAVACHVQRIDAAQQAVA